MASYQQIPTYSDTHYSQTTTLDGAEYLLSFDYNQREDCWYLSIALADGTDLVNGLKLLCNWPLTRSCADDRMPQGELMVASGDPTNLTPPGHLDLASGGRCTLFYIPADLMP